MVLGKILKPHGVNGELKLQAYIDSYFSVKKIKKVGISDRIYEVVSIRGSDTFLYVKLLGIDTVSAADSLRNLEVTISRNDAPKLPEGRYYIDDLIGCSVISDGLVLGTLYDVLQNGSADVYCVKGERSFMFPFVDDVIDDINIEEKIITLNPSGSKRVIVYED